MSVTPDFIGQIYKDTNTGNLWRANSLTPGDWTLELQNSKMRWTPNNGNLPGQIMFSGWENDPAMIGITSIILEAATLEDIDVENAGDLVSLSCPNLTNLTGGNTGLYINNLYSGTTLLFPLLATAGGVNIGLCPLLTTLNISGFTSAAGNFAVQSCSSLVSLDLSALVSCEQLLCTLNPSLSTVDVSAWVPTNGKVQSLAGNALTDTSVNAILARCVANAGFVSGKIDVSGGTNAAPTGQGIIDKATLNARLAGLAVTN